VVFTKISVIYLLFLIDFHDIMHIFYNLLQENRSVEYILCNQHKCVSCYIVTN